MVTPLIQVGFDKYGQMDFRVMGTVMELTIEQKAELWTMTCTAIAVAHDMWSREQERKHSAEQAIKEEL